MTRPAPIFPPTEVAPPVEIGGYTEVALTLIPEEAAVPEGVGTGEIGYGASVIKELAISA